MVFKLLVCSWHHNSHVNSLRKNSTILTPTWLPCHVLANLKYVALSSAWKFIKKGPLNGV